MLGGAPTAAMAGGGCGEKFGVRVSGGRENSRSGGGISTTASGAERHPEPPLLLLRGQWQTWREAEETFFSSGNKQAAGGVCVCVRVCVPHLSKMMEDRGVPVYSSGFRSLIRASPEVRWFHLQEPTHKSQLTHQQTGRRSHQEQLFSRSESATSTERKLPFSFTTKLSHRREGVAGNPERNLSIAAASLERTRMGAQW